MTATTYTAKHYTTTAARPLWIRILSVILHFALTIAKRVLHRVTEFVIIIGLHVAAIAIIDARHEQIIELAHMVTENIAGLLG